MTTVSNQDTATALKHALEREKLANQRADEWEQLAQRRSMELADALDRLAIANEVVDRAREFIAAWRTMDKPELALGYKLEDALERLDAKHGKAATTRSLAERVESAREYFECAMNPPTPDREPTREEVARAGIEFERAAEITGALGAVHIGPLPPSKPTCWCRRCDGEWADALQTANPGMWPMRRFIVCPNCGNKRCPRAEWHGFWCTSSNAVGQVGLLVDSQAPIASLPEPAIATRNLAETTLGDVVRELTKDPSAVTDPTTSTISGVGSNRKPFKDAVVLMRTPFKPNIELMRGTLRRVPPTNPPPAPSEDATAACAGVAVVADAIDWEAFDWATDTETHQR